MPKWAMVIDLDKCTACQACTIACRTENNIPFSSPQEAEKGRAILWMEMITITEGEFPHVKRRIIPRPCFHCDNPPCIKVCPVRATYKSEDGIVGQIYPRCIGCRYCTTACPYTARYFNWYAPDWNGEMGSAVNNDVSVRPKGVVEKCSFCHHRLLKARDKARAEGRPFLPEDYVPACVEACPSNAMFFGDLDDPKSLVSELSRNPRAFRFMEDLGTEPKVIYLREGE